MRCKNSCVDSGRNYSQTAASLGNLASPGDFREPMAVSDHACSTVAICSQLSRMRSLCHESVCRPSQDRTGIASMSLVGVAIAATIKETAAGDVPHVVQTNNNTYVSWQAFQPCWNIKPIRYSMQMYNINVCQLFRTRRQQQSPGPMPRLARQRH